MGIQDPAPVTQNSIPVQSHAFLDTKRKDLGLTDRQTLKSAKYDRLLYGRKNVEPGLAKHLVNHKKMYEKFCLVQDLEFEKKIKMATGEIKIKMVRVPTFIVHDPVGFKQAVIENRGYKREDKFVQKVII